MLEAHEYLGGLSLKQRKICAQCSACGHDYTADEPIPYCTPARLEKDLRRIPTYQEAIQNQIKIDNISGKCPNRYKSLLSSKIR
jgi:hypothetical protein